MTILKSIWRELQNEPQLDYATAMNFSRIHHFFVTETRNRKPNNRGIHNRNRNFKNRARILISAHYCSRKIVEIHKIFKNHHYSLYVTHYMITTLFYWVEVGGLFFPIVKTFSSITGLRHNRHAAEKSFSYCFFLYNE